MNEHRNVRIGVGLLTAAALLMAGWIMTRILLGMYVDALWFDSIGYVDVFWTMLRERVSIGLTVFILTAIALFANIKIAYRRAPMTERTILGNFEMPPEQMDRLVRSVLLAGSFLAAVLIGASAAGNWIEFVNFRMAIPFGVTEPVFDNDVAFYVFRLPAIAYVVKMVFVITLLCTAAAMVIYLMRGHIALDENRYALGMPAFQHVSLLGGIAALCAAMRFWWSRYELLVSRRGTVFGAGYTDIHAAIGAYNILLIIALIFAAWLIINTFVQRRPGNLYAVIGFLICWGVFEVGYPWAVQSFVVRPNEWEREAKYIERNMEFTRRAFGLEDVDVRAWTGDGIIQAEDLEEFAGTAENLKLWESYPLRDVLNQKQRIRTYYVFQDVDTDRYVIDGKLRPVMIGVRELAPEQLPESSQIWTNLHLQYTHGYGMSLSYGNKAAPGGLPEYLVRNIPPEPHPEFTVDQPRIYFGERTYLYALTNTRLPEFDYPGDPDNFYNVYSGEDGILVSGMLRRFLLSWYLGAKDILFTEQFTEESRIHLFRHIRQRVQKVAPFLSLDEDPYPVLHDGRIVWILDAYTMTRRYPYSEPVGGANYIRNSVKATVDAYDGTVILYRMDDEDPLLEIFDRLFPDLLQPIDAMPESLRAHIRYPRDLFRIQTVVYRRYHVTDPQVFFTGEDVWTFPRSTETGVDTPEDPRYIIMELPGSDFGPEFVVTRSFTVEGRDNMVGWMAGGSDGDNYGKLTLLRMPKRRNILGPNQAKGRFNQDPEVSSFRTLIGQLGSSVVPSKVLTIPIREGLLYLQSLYVEDPNIRIPELKQVLVGHGDRVAMAPTIGEALERLFDDDREPVLEMDADVMLEQFDLPAADMGEARRLYQTAQEQMRAGDWQGFGEAFERLGQLLGIGEEAVALE